VGWDANQLLRRHEHLPGKEHGPKLKFLITRICNKKPCSLSKMMFILYSYECTSFPPHFASRSNNLRKNPSFFLIELVFFFLFEFLSQPWHYEFVYQHAYCSWKQEQKFYTFKKVINVRKLIVKLCLLQDLKVRFNPHSSTNNSRFIIVSFHQKWCWKARSKFDSLPPTPSPPPKSEVKVGFPWPQTAPHF